MQRMRRYQFARSALFTGWTADGRIAISTRFGNTSQIHIVDKPMGARRQITFFDEPINGGDWSPTGARKGMIYTRDTGGDENYQLEYLDPASTDPVRLTNGQGRADTGLWSPDGTQYAFQWTVRNGVASDVYIDDPLDKRAPELVFEAPEVGWNAVDWSPDGKSLLLEHFVSANESYLWVYDLATHAKREIEPAKVKAGRGGNFSRDGKGVYIASDLGSEFRTLRYVDLATGKVTPLTDHIKWDIDEFVLSRDGRYLAYIANEDGASRLGVMDLVQHADLIPPKLPFGVIGSLGFDPAGKRLAFSLQTASAPYDVWVWTLADGAFERWTESEIGPLDATKLVAPALVHYPTFDKVGRQAARDSGLGVQARGRGTVSGADQHPWRTGSPGAADVQRVGPAVGRGTRLRRDRAERARLERLRQDLPRARQRHEARGLGEGHRRAARLDRDAARPRREARGRHRRFLRRLHVARDDDALQRPAARRHRHRRHQQLRHLPREHGGVPPRPAPAGIRR